MGVCVGGFATWVPVGRDDTAKRLGTVVGNRVDTAVVRAAPEPEPPKPHVEFFTMLAETVAVDGHDTWHRVRVGPYADLGMLNETHSRLSSNGYDSMVLKLGS